MYILLAIIKAFCLYVLLNCIYNVYVSTSFVMSNLSNVDLDGGMVLGSNNSVASRAGGEKKKLNNV